MQEDLGPHLRHPAVAGTFYPSGPQDLSQMVSQFIAKAVVPAPEGDVLSLIVPHAGYVFSGQVAAFAYRFIEDIRYDSVILIGLCHHGLKDVSIFSSGQFVTPLGAVPVDEELAGEITNHCPRLITDNPFSHRNEHSLEVQIPFLQTIWAHPFSIVPILVDDDLFVEPLAEAVSHAVKNTLKKVLIIASTDLSHYPSYETAVQVDRESIEAIKKMDFVEMDQVERKWLGKGIMNLHCTVCSTSAVKTVLRASQQLGAKTVKLLDYANSGDVPIGEKDQVVGYTSIAVMK